MMRHARRRASSMTDAAWRSTEKQHFFHARCFSDI
ncbi:hypothetical protein PARMER_00543 [Parabacteroides merdae ATCC 43184]|nr:hypothetical protein PARMER_00543 [Parabacteroides merdae ATCC 43184]